MLLLEGDFEIVRCFVGDVMLVLDTEAFSAILLCGIDDTSEVDLFSLLSVLSTEGVFVMVFGLDGSTTVALGTEGLSFILIWGDGGRTPIEYLNSLLSVLSREGDLLMIFGLVGDSILLFAWSLFIRLWDTERAALLFLVANLSPEVDFEEDFVAGSLLGFGDSMLVWSKSKRSGLPLDFKPFLSIGATSTTTLEVGSRLFVAAMLLLIQSLLPTVWALKWKD